MLRTCYDRILPGEAPHPGRMLSVNGTPARAAFATKKLWPNGSSLRVAFLGGTISQQETVVREAVQWLDYANLKFVFGSIQGSHIRISFNEDDGAWSYIGKDALGIPANSATMNLGWLDGGVILHEFGHAIGLQHEHQNPRGKQIQWNKAVVNAALSGPPNYWNQGVIDSNIYARYAVDQISGSSMDPTSIMMYSFPKEWTLDGFSTPFNTSLSVLDRAFARSTYPGIAGPVNELTLTLDDELKAGKYKLMPV